MEARDQLDLTILERRAIGIMLDWQVLADAFLESGSQQACDVLMDAEDQLLELARRIRVAMAVAGAMKDIDGDDDDDLPIPF